MPMRMSREAARKRPPPPDVPEPARRAAAWAGALLPMAMAVAVYAGAFRHGFIWDDPLVLEQLRAMHGPRDLLVPPDVVPKFYYRPLTFLTFLLDRALGGESPFWFHVTVVAWHAGVTGLVYGFARSLLGAPRSLEAALAALLFAVHPVHVESVAWIAGRSDVIATAFVLLTVLLAARTARGWTAWAAGATLLLGLLAKEVALAGLVLVPARDWCAARRFFWRRYAPLGLAAGLYGVLRHAALGTVGGGFPTGAGVEQVGRDVLAALAWYGWKLLLPVHLSAYVPQVPEAPWYPVVGFLGLAAAMAAAAWAWRAGHGAAAFLILWLLVGLAPSLGVIVRRSASAVLAERYLYLPSVGAVVLAAWGLARLRGVPRWRWRAAVAVLGAAAAAGVGQSVARTRVWADDVVFWTDVVAKTPGDGMPHRELGTAYMRRNRLDDAERELGLALAGKSSPEGYVMAYGNLGNLYLRRRQLDAAEAAFQAALQLARHSYLYSGLGRAAMMRAEQAQARDDDEAVVRHVRAAREWLNQALALAPRDHKSHVLLGQVLASLGEHEAARRHLRTALEIEPRGAIADVARRYLRELGS